MARRFAELGPQEVQEQRPPRVEQASRHEHGLDRVLFGHLVFRASLDEPAVHQVPDDVELRQPVLQTGGSENPPSATTRANTAISSNRFAWAAPSPQV